MFQGFVKNQQRKGNSTRWPQRHNFQGCAKTREFQNKVVTKVYLQSFFKLLAAIQFQTLTRFQDFRPC